MYTHPHKSKHSNTWIWYDSSRISEGKPIKKKFLDRCLWIKSQTGKEACVLPPLFVPSQTKWTETTVEEEETLRSGYRERCLAQMVCDSMTASFWRLHGGKQMTSYCVLLIKPRDGWMGGSNALSLHLGWWATLCYFIMLPSNYRMLRGLGRFRVGRRLRDGRTGSEEGRGSDVGRSGRRKRKRADGALLMRWTARMEKVRFNQRRERKWGLEIVLLKMGGGQQVMHGK